MRIFVLGAGATGSLLAELLERQGHKVTCGDKNLERARRFIAGSFPCVPVNGRNVWSIVRAARGSHLLVNAASAAINQTVLRAALRLRVHYLDMATRLSRNPFKAEQLRWHKRFQQKRRTALINAGVAPGLTNLLVKRSAEMCDRVERVQIRLYESTESEDPISTWSHEAAYDEATSRPRIYRQRHFRFGKRFGEPERFRFPRPIGEVTVYLAAQDEVGTLPHFVPMQAMDVKIGGNEIERLRRWYRQGKLQPSRGLVAKRFPQTPTPRQVARLIRRGILSNARFAAAVLVEGTKADRPLRIRWFCTFPTLYQIRIKGLYASPIAYATAHMAALFVKYFPRDLWGVHPPEALPEETRAAILADVKARGFEVKSKIVKLPRLEEEEI
jgi:hypothetical protein